MTMTSMTGYGRASCQVFGRRLVVEIRSVNHRFFDFKLRLPWLDAAVESLLGATIRRRIERGAVTVTVRDEGGMSAPEVRVNLPLARSYHRALGELVRELGLPATEVPVAVVAGLRDVLSVGEPERSGEELFEALRPGAEAALDGLVTMRRREGEALAVDLRAHAGALGRAVAGMASLAQEAPDHYRRRLEERLARVVGSVEVDPQRLAQEVAIFADRTDTSEEFVRLRSHLGQFEGLLGEQGAVGRKLDFLLQELNREVNTIGSKAQGADIAALVVEAKATLEKMREQVQNVE